MGAAPVHADTRNSWRVAPHDPHKSRRDSDRSHLPARRRRSCEDRESAPDARERDRLRRWPSFGYFSRRHPCRGSGGTPTSSHDFAAPGGNALVWIRDVGAHERPRKVFAAVVREAGEECFETVKLFARSQRCVSRSPKQAWSAAARPPRSAFGRKGLRTFWVTNLAAGLFWV